MLGPLGAVEEEIQLPAAVEELVFAPVAEERMGDPGFDPVEKDQDEADAELNADLARVGLPGNLPPDRENPPRKNPVIDQTVTNLQRLIREKAKGVSNQQIHNLFTHYAIDPGYANKILDGRKVGDSLRSDVRKYKTYVREMASVCETMVEEACEGIVETQGRLSEKSGGNAQTLGKLSADLIEGMIQIDQTALYITAHAESIAHIMKQLPSQRHSPHLRELYRVHEITGTARQLVEGVDLGTLPLQIIGEFDEEEKQLDNFAQICQQLVTLCEVRNSILKAQGQPQEDKRLQGHVKRAVDTVINSEEMAEYHRSFRGMREQLKPGTSIESLKEATNGLTQVTDANLIREGILT